MAVTSLAWVVEQPGSRSKNELSLYNENGLRSRRFHHKSRKGCIACKQRRVKCSEQMPECSQCRDKCLKCEYPTGSRTSPVRLAPSDLEKSHNSVTSDPAISSRIMQVLIKSNAPCVELADTAVYKRNHALEVIDHFATCQEPWLGSSTCQRIFQEHGVRLALNAAHLVHAMIAISAAHLAAMQSAGEERKKYWIASTLHYHHSLGMYSSAIVNNLHDEDADAIFASGLLHAMLAFIKTPKASEHISIQDDDGPTWIMSMQGIRTLMNTPSLRSRLETGVWRPMIQEFDRWQDFVPDDTGHCGSQLPPSTIGAFKDLCGLGSNSIAETQAQIAMLDRLFYLDTADHDIDCFLAFIVNASPACINGLKADDEGALLVLAYWLALFSNKFDQWWISLTAKIECTRICRHLEQSRDSRIRALLTFPAKICGYDLGRNH